MTVKVSQAAVNEQNSSFTPNTIDLVANGTDSQVLTLSVKDASNNPINISEKDIDLKITSNPAKATNTTVSEWKKVSTGTYEVTVTAGTQVEKVILSPTVLGVTLPAATVKVSEGDVAELNSTLVASPKEIVADNTEESTITLTLFDENKNPIKGKEVTFNVNGVENTAISGTTEQDGIYTAKLTGTTSGTATVTASVDGKELSLKDEIKLKAGAISEEKSTITASKETISTDIEKSEITLKLVDKYDNPIEQGHVTFASSLEGGEFSKPVFDGIVYKTDFSSTAPGTANIYFSYNGITYQTVSTNVVVVENSIDIQKSSFTPEQASIQANGTDTQKFVLKLFNTTGQPVNLNDINTLWLNVDKTIIEQNTHQSRISNFIQTGEGEYTTTVTAGDCIEKIALKPQIRKLVFGPGNLMIGTN